MSNLKIKNQNLTFLNEEWLNPHLFSSKRIKNWVMLTLGFILLQTTSYWLRYHYFTKSNGYIAGCRQEQYINKDDSRIKGLADSPLNNACRSMLRSENSLLLIDNEYFKEDSFQGWSPEMGSFEESFYFMNFDSRNDVMARYHHVDVPCYSIINFMISLVKSEEKVGVQSVAFGMVENWYFYGVDVCHGEEATPMYTSADFCIGLQRILTEMAVGCHFLSILTDLVYEDFISYSWYRLRVSRFVNRLHTIRRGMFRYIYELKQQHQPRARIHSKTLRNRFTSEIDKEISGDVTTMYNSRKARCKHFYDLSCRNETGSCLSSKTFGNIFYDKLTTQWLWVAIMIFMTSVGVVRNINKKDMTSMVFEMIITITYVSMVNFTNNMGPGFSSDCIGDGPVTRKGARSCALDSPVSSVTSTVQSISPRKKVGARIRTFTTPKIVNPNVVRDEVIPESDERNGYNSTGSDSSFNFSPDSSQGSQHRRSSRLETLTYAKALMSLSFETKKKHGTVQLSPKSPALDSINKDPSTDPIVPGFQSSLANLQLATASDEVTPCQNGDENHTSPYPEEPLQSVPLTPPRKKTRGRPLKSLASQHTKQLTNKQTMSSIYSFNSSQSLGSGQMYPDPSSNVTDSVTRLMTCPICQLKVDINERQKFYKHIRDKHQGTTAIEMDRLLSEYNTAVICATCGAPYVDNCGFGKHKCPALKEGDAGRKMIRNYVPCLPSSSENPYFDIEPVGGTFARAKEKPVYSIPKIARQNFQGVTLRLVKIVIEALERSDDAASTKAIEAFQSIPALAEKCGWEKDFNPRNARRVRDLFEKLMNMDNVVTFILNEHLAIIQGQRDYWERVHEKPEVATTEERDKQFRKLETRLEDFIKVGRLSRAMQALESWIDGNKVITAHKLTDEAVIAELTRLFPERPDSTTSTPIAAPTPLVIDVGDVEAAYDKLTQKTAQAFSGWTNELIAETCKENAELTVAVCRLFNLVLQGKGGPAANWTAARLVMLEKPGSKLAIRPIAIGDVWTRFLYKVTANKVTPSIAPVLAPHQYGVGVKGGAEIVIHTLRSYALLIEDRHQMDTSEFESADDPLVLISIDCVNAFGTIFRDAIVRGIEKHTPSLLPVYMWEQTSDTPLLSSEGSLACLNRTGITQGNPLSPLLFALGLQPVLEDIQERNPDTNVIAFLDDMYLVGPRSKAIAAFNYSQQSLGSVGLQVNFSKTSILDPMSKESPIPGVTLSQIGFKALGSSFNGEFSSELGGKTFTERWLDGELRAKKYVANYLTRFRANTAFHLLQSCINTRPTYIVRTTPPWETDSSTKSFDETIDRVSATLAEWDGDLPERAKILRGLPIQMGGCSLKRTNDTRECAYSASLTTAFQSIRKDHPRAWQILTSANHTHRNKLDVLFQETITDYKGLSDFGFRSLQQPKEEVPVVDLQVFSQRSLQKVRDLRERKRCLEDLVPLGAPQRAWTLSCATAGTAPYLAYTIKPLGDLSVSDETLQENLRLRLLLPVVNPSRAEETWTCTCGLVSEGLWSQDSLHALTCKCNKKRSMVRHTQVVEAIVKFANKCSEKRATVEVEYTLTGIDDSSPKVDVKINLGPRTYLIDATVINPASSNSLQLHSDCTENAASKCAEVRKHRHYSRRLSKQVADTVVAFAVEATGRIGEEAEDFITSFVDHCKQGIKDKKRSGNIIQSASYLRKRIAIACAQFNAGAVEAYRQCATSTGTKGRAALMNVGENLSEDEQSTVDMDSNDHNLPAWRVHRTRIRSNDINNNVSGIVINRYDALRMENENTTTEVMQPITTKVDSSIAPKLSKRPVRLTSIDSNKQQQPKLSVINRYDALRAEIENTITEAIPTITTNMDILTAPKLPRRPSRFTSIDSNEQLQQQPQQQQQQQQPEIGPNTQFVNEIDTYVQAAQQHNIPNNKPNIPKHKVTSTPAMTKPSQIPVLSKSFKGSTTVIQSPPRVYKVGISVRGASSNKETILSIREPTNRRLKPSFNTTWQVLKDSILRGKGNDKLIRINELSTLLKESQIPILDLSRPLEKKLYHSTAPDGYCSLRICKQAHIRMSTTNIDWNDPKSVKQTDINQDNPNDRQELSDFVDKRIELVSVGRKCTMIALNQFLTQPGPLEKEKWLHLSEIYELTSMMTGRSGISTFAKLSDNQQDVTCMYNSKYFGPYGNILNEIGISGIPSDSERASFTFQQLLEIVKDPIFIGLHADHFYFLQNSQPNIEEAHLEAALWDLGRNLIDFVDNDEENRTVLVERGEISSSDEERE